jgi:hypothetical protein
MCFGQQPKQPEVVYQGPSDEVLASRRQDMDDWMSGIQAQNQTFQDNLNKQIAQANEGYSDLETELAGLEKAAKTGGQKSINDAKTAGNKAASGASTKGAAATGQAAANALTKQVGALTVTTEETDPEQAQTTTAAKTKKKKNKNLKISTGGTASSKGSGLNIGV